MQVTICRLQEVTVQNKIEEVLDPWPNRKEGVQIRLWGRWGSKIILAQMRGGENDEKKGVWWAKFIFIHYCFSVYFFFFYFIYYYS